LHGPENSWNLLGSDADGSLLASNRHVSADENSHDCCRQVRFMVAGMTKMLLRLGL